MLTTKLHIPADVEKALEGLSTKEIRAMLRAAIDDANGPTGLMMKHWLEGQTEWDRPDGKNGLLFVKSGTALKAMSTKSKARQIRISKSRKGGTWRATIGLRKMVGGKNIYSMVQRGKFAGVDKDGNRISKKPMLISANLPGDDPVLVRALTKQIKEILATKGFT